jgi:hypothetical protein
MLHIGKSINTASNAASHSAAASKKAKAKPEAQEAAEQKDWTVLMYIAGDNDLEPYAAHMMQQIEDKCGSTDNINVVAQLGRMEQKDLKKLYASQNREYKPTGIDGDWGGIRRYYVTQQDRKEDQKDAILSKCLGQTDDKKMSDATSLADFLVWGMKKYPAERTMVVLADHGGGFLGAFTSDASASGHSIMKPDQIASAFKIAETATGQKPDVVDMVACLMGSSEVAYQMKDRAKYLLASEEIGTTASFDYGPIIAGIDAASEKGKPMSPKALAKSIVHHYDDKPEAFQTKAAIDLPKMEAVKESVALLVESLRAGKVPLEVIAGAIKGAQNFGITSQAIYPFYDQMRDLQGVAENLAENKDVKDRKVKLAAKAVVASVQAAVVDNLAHKYQRQEVMGNGQTLDGKEKFTDFRVYEGQYEANGLSVFAPLNERIVKGEKMAEYRGLDFSRDTGWGDFIVDLNKQIAEARELEKQGKVVARPEDPNLAA